MNFFKTKNARVIIWIVVLLAVALFLWLTAPKSASKNEPGENVNNTLQPSTNAPAVETAGNANKPKAPAKKATPPPVGFTEKKTSHFVSASIANNETIAQVPSYLTLTFDANLDKSAQTLLTVKKNDITDATAGTMSINENKLVVRLNTQVADGDYYVYYVSCFADTGCQDGRFGYHLKLP